MNGVSVILCCYNSSSRIIPTLKHLQEQVYYNSINWEVIIVDNASTDGTSVVAKECWDKMPVTSFRIVIEDKPGLMNARVKGIMSASYEIVSFIDDDNWVEKNWIEKVFNVLNSDIKIGACGGFSEAVFENIKPDWFSDYEDSFAVGRQANESGFIENGKDFLWGAGLSFRKSVWIELQKRGFKNLTTGREGKSVTAGEDTELCYAFRLLGFRLYYMSDLSLTHYMPADRMNFSYLEKMITGFGKANVRLNCYRVLLYPENFRLRSWWYEWAFAVKSMLQLSVKLFFISDQLKKQKAKTDIAYWKGYALQTWNDKAQIQKNVSLLRVIFSS